MVAQARPLHSAWFRVSNTDTLVCVCGRSGRAVGPSQQSLGSLHSDWEEICFVLKINVSGGAGDSPLPTSLEKLTAFIHSDFGHRLSHGSPASAPRRKGGAPSGSEKL